MQVRLSLTRSQILAFRRNVGALDERLPPGASSLRTAAWAGMQDSMPRAALLSIHARVEGTKPSTWEDPSLVQLWGPRFSAYVVAKQDLAIFSLGRLDEPGPSRRQADDIAARLATFHAGRTMRYDDAGPGLGMHGNRLRYAAATGTVLSAGRVLDCRRAGPSRHRRSIPATLDSSSLAGTCTSSARRDPRPSRSGLGSERVAPVGGGGGVPAAAERAGSDRRPLGRSRLIAANHLPRCGRSASLDEPSRGAGRLGRNC
jgi:hypothetical protein